MTTHMVRPQSDINKADRQQGDMHDAPSLLAPTGPVKSPDGPNDFAEELSADWEHACRGDAQAQALWRSEGGQWAFENGGIAISNNETEWSNLIWQRVDASIMRRLRNFVIEVAVSGKAEAAGISFGDYKDFLAHLDDKYERRYLQLEIDLDAGSCSFRVDGQLQHRAWWDSAVHSVDDLLRGQFTLKARHAKELRFQSLSLHTFESSCHVSVIITCYRFLQRLRVTLRNWCHQTIPYGGYEILVVNPSSPDGTHEHLAAVTMSYPHVRVRELKIEARSVINKAAMINQAVKASRGEWIWLTDSDCLYSPNTLEKTLAIIQGRKSRLFFGERRYLTSSQTSDLLSGRRDGLRDFDDLCCDLKPRASDNEPWGYTQIVQRSTLERIPYREQFNYFAHSDSLFIQDCKRRGIMPEPVDGLFCLHLDHPFAWYGTDAFL